MYKKYLSSNRDETTGVVYQREMSTAAPACDTCLQEAASGSPREARSSRTSSAVGGGSERYGEVEGSLMSDGTTFQRRTFSTRVEHSRWLFQA